MEKKTNIAVNSVPGTETVIREGKAAEIREPLKIAITGTLSAPNDFLDSTKIEEFKAETSHALIDTDSGTILLVLDERDFNHATNIKGMLKVFADLEAFKINTEEKRSTKELITFLKRNKFYFADKDAHTEFLTKLNKFSADITTKIQEHRDNGGNSLNSIEKQVTASVGKMEFKLELPIYKGYPNVSFLVEVCMDPTDKSVLFFLESVELFTLMKDKKEEYLNNEIKTLTDKFACSVVYTS